MLAALVWHEPSAQRVSSIFRFRIRPAGGNGSRAMPGRGKANRCHEILPAHFTKALPPPRADELSLGGPAPPAVCRTKRSGVRPPAGRAKVDDKCVPPGPGQTSYRSADRGESPLPRHLRLVVVESGVGIGGGGEPP